MTGLSTIIPAFPTTKHSLLGAVQGNHVYIQYEYNDDYYIVSPHGNYKCDSNFQGAIPKPGGGIWLVCDSSSPWKDIETEVKITLQDKDSPFQNLPLLHFISSTIVMNMQVSSCESTPMTKHGKCSM